MSLMFFISCSKQEPVIAWEKGLTFGEILDTAGNKYIMIDFEKHA